jgi:serine O-acetyltransferase
MKSYIKDKKMLKEYIKSDLYRYNGQTNFKCFIKTFFDFPGFKYSYILRKCNFYKQNGIGIKYFFYKILLRIYRSRYHFDIPYQCDIGKGLYIGHFGRITINPEQELVIM